MKSLLLLCIPAAAALSRCTAYVGGWRDRDGSRRWESGYDGNGDARWGRR